jgi:hypothetical protein
MLAHFNHISAPSRPRGVPITLFFSTLVYIIPLCILERSVASF